MPEATTTSSVAHIDGWAAHSSGSGPGLVLLHANGGSHRDFDAIFGALSSRFTVHALDWPGHGDSTCKVEQSACAFAARLPAVLDELPGAPFIVIGNSIGGFAAVRLAAVRPDLVKALILVSPGGFTPRWPGALLACRLIGSKAIAPKAMRWLPRLYLRGSGPPVAAIQQRAAAASRQPQAVATYRSVWRSFTDRDHDAGPFARSVTAPTMLAWGTRDPVLPWRVDGRRARAAFANAQISTFRCGHQPFAEQPALFLAAVQQFLQAHSESPK